MNLRHLFISLAGRISRRQFWLALAVLVFASFAVSFAVLSLLGVSLTATGFDDAESALANARTACLANLIVFALLAWPAAAVMLKRRHDRGSAGIEIWVYLVLAVFVQLMPGLGIDYAATLDPDTGQYTVVPGLVANTLGIAFGLFALTLLVTMGVLKGTPGPNSHGPDPLARDAGPA